MQPTSLPPNGSPSRGALKVAAVYLLLATLWIAGSDLAFLAFFGLEPSLTLLEIAKGLGFVVVTGAALYVLVRRQLAAQRELVERRLADELWFRALVENAQEVFSVLDADGRSVYRSPAFERILGYDSVEAGALRFLDLVHPADRPLAQREIDQILRMPYRTTRRLWIRLRARDGTWHICEAVGTNLLTHPAVGGIVVNWRERDAPAPDGD